MYLFEDNLRMSVYLYKIFSKIKNRPPEKSELKITSKKFTYLRDNHYC